MFKIRNDKRFPRFLEGASAATGVIYSRNEGAGGGGQLTCCWVTAKAKGDILKAMYTKSRRHLNGTSKYRYSYSFVSDNGDKHKVANISTKNRVPVGYSGAGGN
jgi:hypothetical protein